MLNPIFAFVRLNCPILLDDFSEINKPTRFLILILGPSGSAVNVLDLGRAFGALFTDQLFCQLTAYKANTRASLVRGLKTYLSELTVLPPSSWDTTIRLDPPKNPPTLETRLVNRVAFKEKQKRDAEEHELEDECYEEQLLQEKKDADHGEDEGLQFTGRLFGGLMADIKRKAPWYLSDFTDALNIQVFISSKHHFDIYIVSSKTF